MKKVLSLVLALVLCLVPCGVALASGNQYGIDFGYGTLDPSMQTTVNNILGVIKTIGYVIAIAMVMFAGIKYLMAGVGEKAKVKEMLFPMLAGAVLIAGAVTIVGWVFGIAG